MYEVKYHATLQRLLLEMLELAIIGLPDFIQLNYLLKNIVLLYFVTSSILPDVF
ncbi:MAG: hypothetical protein GF353_03435 [Candidatus Lokiarchaeota archaeon]|nr:hypothetical protein [Candidatus Lokiarchaeota archaeon]